MAQKLVAVVGPTAVGKTEYVIRLAQRFGGEVVSCDSMQLYKFMDIGSAKPTAEEQAAMKHYLVDEIDPRTPFSVAEYQRLAKDAIRVVADKGKLPFISGGTGLYFNALVYDMDFAQTPGNPEIREQLRREKEEIGLDALYARLQEKNPVIAAKIDPHNEVKIIRALEAEAEGRHIGDFSRDLKRNPDYEFVMIGLSRDRAELYDRINRRVDILMDLGLVDEVKGLLDMGLSAGDISMKGIGYKEIIGYLQGEYDLTEAVELVKKNTRHLAKKQMTWFRRYPDMQWFNISEYESGEDCLAAIGDYIETSLAQGGGQPV